MAVIHWWLLQIAEEDIEEFGNRYVANYEGGMTYDKAIDTAGKSILLDKGLLPDDQYLWPKPDWANNESWE